MQKIRRTFLLVALTTFFTAAGYSADYIVTKTADTNDGACDADCSLREAILASNTSSSADTIVFDRKVFGIPQTIVLNGSEIVIQNSNPVTIYGPGSHLLTVSGNNASRIITVDRGSSANIYGMTFTAGNGVGSQNSGRAGALYNVGGYFLISDCVITGNSAATGGGLNNASSTSPTPAVPGTMVILNSIVSNNTSTSSGGGLQNFSTSTLIVENSLFTNNQSGGSTGGGAMQANGIVRLTNTTISGNRSPGGTGGGIQSNGGDQVLTNVTITDNRSATNGGGIHRASSVAGLSLRNTIIAGNIGITESPDVTNIANATFVSLGNNLIGNVGTSHGWIGTDVLNIDPRLAPLGLYGGATMTHALMSTSPAIDAGSNCVRDISCSTNPPSFPIVYDQRGAGRISRNVDIGAFEYDENYYATLPRAVVGDQYNRTLVPIPASFTYALTGGSFGELVFSTSTNISGIPTTISTGTATVLITGPSGSTTLKYRLDTLADEHSVPVFGQVVNADNMPMRNVRVELFGRSGEIYPSLTNAMGYFRFDNVPVGNIFSVRPNSREFPTFHPRNSIFIGETIQFVYVVPAQIAVPTASEKALIGR